MNEPSEFNFNPLVWRPVWSAHDVDALFEFIAHGDDAHRAWLKRALWAFFQNQSLPPPEVQ